MSYREEEIAALEKQVADYDKLITAARDESLKKRAVQMRRWFAELLDIKKQQGMRVWAARDGEKTTLPECMEIFSNRPTRASEDSTYWIGAAVVYGTEAEKMFNGKGSFLSWKDAPREYRLVMVEKPNDE